MSYTSPWRVSQHAGEPGKQSDLFVYLVDIATGWIVAGSFQATEMEEARIQAMRERWDQSVLLPLVNMIRDADEVQMAP